MGLNEMFEAVGSHATGAIDDKELRRLEEVACPGCGSCSGMYTANSMNCLTEVIGMALPGNGTIPAVHAARVPAGQRDRRTGDGAAGKGYPAEGYHDPASV